MSTTVYRCPSGVREGTDIEGCGSWNTEAKYEGFGENRVLVVECLDCSIDFQPALEPNVESRERERYKLKLSGEVRFPTEGYLVVEGPPNATHEQMRAVLFERDLSNATWEDSGVDFESAELLGFRPTDLPLSDPDADFEDREEPAGVEISEAS